MVGAKFVSAVAIASSNIPFQTGNGDGVRGALGKDIRLGTLIEIYKQSSWLGKEEAMNEYAVIIEDAGSNFCA